MARVVNLKFTEDGPAPTVELSVAEAALIFKLIGRTSSGDREVIFRGAGAAGEEIYDEFCANWCYPFWENGDPAGPWNGAEYGN